MTLSGSAANDRPDVDRLAAVPLGIVTHASYCAVGRSTSIRTSVGPLTAIGTCDAESGVYETAVAAMTEDERRAAGLRRNGQPRRRPAA